MKKVITFTLLLLATASFSLNAQDQTSFPKSWQGEWKGTLEIFGPQGKVNEVAMELHILPTDSADFTWIIYYGEDKVIGKRDYLIRLVDEKSARFEVDEQNSIFLDAYLLGGKLVELFEVQSNILVATTEKVGEELIFEIISGRLNDPRTTGGEVQGEETIPEVKSFPVNVRQKAVLKRI
ncbi:MAG: hypothetical protein KDC24_02055 [Saprospiraceae bacterium]|nr:hypothetical protein [Saprospiraceae bacterium]